MILELQIEKKINEKQIKRLLDLYSVIRIFYDKKILEHYFNFIFKFFELIDEFYNIIKF